MPAADTLAPPTGPPPGATVPPGTDSPPPPRWLRRLWRIGGSLAAVVLLPFAALQIVSQLAHEEFTVDRQFPADGIATIEVHNSTGRVRIVGQEGGAGTSEGDDMITVTAHVSEGLRSTGHSQRIEGDRLVLDATCPIFLESFCEVTYTVETPPDVDVVVRGDRGASVEGIDGDVDVAADQGSIDLSRLAGTVVADADQGSVRGSGLRSEDVEATTDQGDVFLRFEDAPRRVVVDSDQGDVEVVLPAGPAEYEVVTDSDQGRVTRDIDTKPSTDRSITATTDQGDVTLRYP